ncbi:hypothetical protein HMPREF9430_00419 [Solobacterium moorei F0204]|uniref:Uncharacterized protein n=1 Tax=Solobacterium moorei F0204 TaxID=706433 RepID=E7MLK7_9FIRM|nr:hypothetical protein HMPREF9430_00419 [Solobacterium moorei F0204]
MGITTFLNVYSIGLSTAYSHLTIIGYPQLWITVEKYKLSFIYRMFF